MSQSTSLQVHEVHQQKESVIQTLISWKEALSYSLATTNEALNTFNKILKARQKTLNTYESLLKTRANLTDALTSNHPCREKALCALVDAIRLRNQAASEIQQTKNRREKLLKRMTHLQSEKNRALSILKKAKEDLKAFERNAKA